MYVWFHTIFIGISWDFTGFNGMTDRFDKIWMMNLDDQTSLFHQPNFLVSFTLGEWWNDRKKCVILATPIPYVNSTSKFLDLFISDVSWHHLTNSRLIEVLHIGKEATMEEVWKAMIFFLGFGVAIFFDATPCLERWLGRSFFHRKGTWPVFCREFNNSPLSSMILPAINHHIFLDIDRWFPPWFSYIYVPLSIL